MNLEALHQSISVQLDAEELAPVPGSDEWELRTNVINRAQRRWAESHDWEVLYKEVNTHTSQATGNASITLPTSFRKLASAPLITWDGATTAEYSYINPRQRSGYLASDKYCYILGNPDTGYTLVINPPSLVSGASIYYSYYETPTDLATTTDTSPIPDSNYLVEKTLAELLAIDDDKRSIIAEQRASQILEQLLSSENVKGEAYWDRIKTTEELRYNFKWGRN